MAEFKCYLCSKIVKTGEKFTFTKEGAVHFDCFISNKREKINADKEEELRTLSLILDLELTHLIGMLSIHPQTDEAKGIHNTKYKEIEKQAGETTKRIYEL